MPYGRKLYSTLFFKYYYILHLEMNIGVVQLTNIKQVSIEIYF